MKCLDLILQVKIVKSDKTVNLMLILVKTFLCSQISMHGTVVQIRKWVIWLNDSRKAFELAQKNWSGIWIYSLVHTFKGTLTFEGYVTIIITISCSLNVWPVLYVDAF